MRKLIVEEWISLDGFVTDKNEQLDFFTSVTTGENKYADEDQLKFLETVDTILLGRKTYELFAAFWPAATTDTELIADKLNSTKKMVFSNTLTHAPWGKWPAAEIINGETISAIKKLKSLPGKNMVIWGSISLVQSLIKEKLIDELHLQLCPVLTGGGRRFFTEHIRLQQLKQLEVRRYDTGNIFLSYGINV